MTALPTPAAPVTSIRLAGAAGPAHPTSIPRKGAPLLARLLRPLADAHLADRNRDLETDNSFLRAENDRLDHELTTAQAELQQWRHGSPRLAALIADRGRQ